MFQTVITVGLKFGVTKASRNQPKALVVSDY